jgi:Holliday junction resolvase
VRRIPRKRDANELDIITALHQHGWSVQRMSARGAPDLVAGKGDRLVLIEVKGAKGKLTGDQEVWHAAWRGPKPVIVRTVADVEGL